LGLVVPAAKGVKYFYDSSDLKGYDLLARSAFFRVVMANRQQFSSLVFLSWVEGISLAARTFVEAMGEGAELLTERSVFEAKLYTLAPRARSQLDAAKRGRAYQTKGP
jgi:hypothetical protein